MAAGLGFKTFTTGEVLTAADTNGYLMQGVLVFASTAARDAAITSPQEGQFAFTKDTDQLWYRSASAWVASGATGDIEGVTAGIGISGGGTSGTVTVTNSMATAIDSKGDLVAGTGADTFSRLGVGANNTVLTADSAEATGLKWATAGASATSFLLINSGGTSLTGATTVTISGLSGYNTLLIYAADIGLSGAGTTATIRFNADSTAGNYLQEGLKMTSGATMSRLQKSPTTATSLDWMTTGAAGEDSYGFAMVFGANGTGFKSVMQNVGASGVNGVGNYGSGVYKGTSVISSVSFISSASNWTDGTVYIYGGN